VHALLGGPQRFSELSHAIPQISDRLLSIRLRELEGAGIVARRVHDEPPVRVEYELTPKGSALEPALTSLRAWACEWLQ
jgi:DNA-binding HxlR family transcriptional regulator